MKRERRSIRLKGYDYSKSGYYFVTICTYQRQCLFGEIVEGKMQLNSMGQTVAQEWQKSAVIRQEIQLDSWVVMPNHFHGIVIIQSQIKQPRPIDKNNIRPSMKPRSLSSLIVGFKSATTKQINKLRRTPGSPVWQRNYYEHIVRSEASLQHIRQYIDINPLQWQIDQLHPSNPSKW